MKETLPESIHPHVTTLQEDIYEAQAIENKLKGIILFFSIVSLLITLLGVYSTITLDTERRQKEVAIRKVNRSRIETDYFIVCPPLYKTADCFRNYCISINLYSHTNMEKSIYCIL